MAHSHDANTGDKRSHGGDDQARPEKAPRVDDKQQTTLDGTVTSDKKGGGKTAATDDDKTKKQHDPSHSNADSNPDDNRNSKHDTAVVPDGRKGSTPPNMLEKGIIYFFIRGRVGINHPHNVSDIARTFMLLRPIPRDAKLGGGPIGDAANSRLLAVPKKKLPKTGRDRWIAFVEKTNASFDDLRRDFLPAHDYDTKTAGVRHSPPAVPLAQGVYAMTTTGRESHLAYIITQPHELGEVQTTLGLREKGSWILSTRNPQYPAPGNTGLPKGPEYSQEIIDEFRSLRWMGTTPRHLVPSAQLLLVGESSGIQKALGPDAGDREDDDDDKNEPLEEMEELEHEDLERMEHLGETESDAIFLDLEAYAKDHPQLQTEF